MTKYIITDQNIDEKRWDAFVSHHPQGNIFQTSPMYQVFLNTKGYRPVRFWALNAKTKSLAGVLMGVVMHEKPGLIGKFSTRAVIQGGPLLATNINKRTLSKLLIQAYDTAVSKEAIWGEIRSFSDTKQTLNILHDYKWEDHLNYLIDLDIPEEELFGNISQTQRKHIKRAQKMGVILEPLHHPRQIAIFYRFLKENYQKIKIPLSDISLFENVYKILVPQSLAQFFYAKHGKTYLGGRLILAYKNQIYDWYAGVGTDRLKYYPNAFLIWEIFCWAKNNRYRLFDFGGAGNPNIPYGPREFKRQFGGKLVNFGRYIKIYSPWKYKLAFWGLKIYQILKSGGKNDN